MEFTVQGGPLEKQRSGCVVAGVYAGRKLSPSAQALDRASGHALQRVLARGDLEGELGTALLLQDLADIAAERVLLVGLGAEGEFRESSYRTALSCAMTTLRSTGAAQATLCLPELPVPGRDRAWKIEQAVLAVMEGIYRFDQLKSKPPQGRRALESVILPIADASETSAMEAIIRRAAAIAEGVLLARDLGNMPANLCTPTYLAEQAQELGKRHGFRVNILEREEIAKLGMGAFFAVARGSRQPPKLIVMEYSGATREAQTIVLVGKGITFDSGGISIKPASEMDEMKFDMCGAASVFGALRAAALMKLPLNIVGIIPATENMPGGDAIKPGDIVTTMSGQTVEILNTDAEGRLILCDALTYAARYKPSTVIDIATLTGACVIALGHVATGLFANDDALARELIAAGDAAHDRVWHLPLWDDYQEQLRSNFADFANIGGRPAGSVTAACFLARFTKQFRWAHLDIAGTAWNSGREKGSTGRPVPLLTQFLIARSDQAGGSAKRR
jgi:leucyl aminopeptidase